jgi:predicted secreted protein
VHSSLFRRLLAIAVFWVLVDAPAFSAEDVTQIVFGQDAAITTTVGLGAIINVRLPAQAAAGFRWQIVAFDHKMIALVADRLERPPVKARRIGEPADHLFVLRTVAAGQTTIRFAYGRPWEKDKPLGSASLSIDVQP